METPTSLQRLIAETTARVRRVRADADALYGALGGQIAAGAQEGGWRRDGLGRR